MQFVGGAGEAGAAVRPELLDLPKQLQETGSPLTVLRRKIGPAEKGFQVRREKDVQRPTALAGRGLNKHHVDFVHIRPLLAVHLDGDKILVEESGDGSVFKRFALHHVAPVAGRVADAQKDGFVLAARLFESFVIPGEPIHGVARVLEKVRRLFARQTIGGMKRRCVRGLCHQGVSRLNCFPPAAVQCL
jgi:hypothetical protein